jgi:hypothetical protein
MADKRKSPGVRQLDNAIVALLLLMLLFFLSAAGYQYINTLPDSFPRGINMELLIFIGLVVGIPLYFKYRKQKKVTDAAALALTPEHPFKVKMTVEPIEKSAFGLDTIRGRALSHVLEIEVTISQKDWKRIKDAGYYDATLFKYPDTVSARSAALMDFPINQLRLGKTHTEFYDLGAAEEAKETALKTLYTLKDIIALHKEGKRSESFEI